MIEGSLSDRIIYSKLLDQGEFNFMREFQTQVDISNRYFKNKSSSKIVSKEVAFTSFHYEGGNRYLFGP